MLSFRKKTTYYVELTDELRIEADTQDEPGEVEFYIARKGYGDKCYLFGVSSDDPKSALTDMLPTFCNYEFMKDTLEKLLDANETIDEDTFAIGLDEM